MSGLTVRRLRPHAAKGMPDWRPPAADGKGLPCPKCGGPTAVYDSRRKSNSVRRIRGCSDCGHRFTTFEAVVGASASPEFAALLVRELREFADRIELLSTDTNTSD